MEESYISVSQVNSYIKNIFDAEYLLQNIFIYGEVGNFNISNGIAYFNLKDNDNVLPCVLFNARMFKIPNVGDLVLLKGSINYYAKGGKLSFNAVSLQEFGKGLLYEKFIELKNKLEGLGYFDQQKKKPIPQFVKNIGVVSSESGAVIQDIINVSRRRNNSVNIILYPAKVQGVGAELEICKGVEFFNSGKVNVDCIIVARGGGSLEDLQPFNTEAVAEAIHNSNIPVVSAVGHETDYTICDFVSDLRAPTPSAAAELVVFDKFGLTNYVKDKFLMINSVLNQKLTLITNNLKNYLFKFNMQINMYNDLNKNIEIVFNKISNKFSEFINFKSQKLIKLDADIKAFNPSRYEKLGLFQILKEGNVVKNICKLVDQDLIEIVGVKNSISAIVTNKKED